MQRVLLYIVLLCVTSCTRTNPKEHIQYLDGYWEIKKVILSDGSKKEYSFSQDIDFFEIKDSIGIRKKVRPQLDGGFKTTNNQEIFTIIIENDSVRLYYKNSLATWKETIISAKENEIVFKNETGNVYFYQRYQKLQL
ncbi:hypothetical protein ATE84_2159 [Aquimarina sp. MAR_2010_214]|uniref:hypothetical protein n=1 Tax=Aquimarina sp. MAR_2010_214 TaxID=1250026 RepID=UPI000C70F715|nr:hypothetical protein [Aquimarina sp. MAR_2010_214]PKV50109.1 hypothetical protein ATE84_2159 [Aquimarina sp. MAR_2010_214]